MRNEFITRVISKLGDLSEEQRREVEQVLVEVISDYNLEIRQTAIVPAESFVPSYFGIFLAKKLLAGRSIGTIKLYKYYLMDFFL